MRIEIHSAADFVMNLLRVKHKKDLTEIQLQNFKGSLSDLMFQNYQRHWYPELPTKGSGYRCIRINGKMDPIIEQAGVAVGIHARILRKMLPQELTMWIDPDEVAYRIGENGSICVLYDTVQIRSSPSSDLGSTGSGTASEEFIMERRLDLSDVSLIDYLHVGSPTKTKLNNSVSSSAGQMSPPLSPPFLNHHNRYQQQHNNSHHHHHHNNHHHNNNNYHNQQQQQQAHPSQHNNNNIHHQSHMEMYHWDNGFNNFNNFNNKVRTQC